MRNFAAIDFETANGKRTSVCSVGIVIVKDGKIVPDDQDDDDVEPPPMSTQDFIKV